MEHAGKYPIWQNFDFKVFWIHGRPAVMDESRPIWSIKAGKVNKLGSCTATKGQADVAGARLWRGSRGARVSGCHIKMWGWLHTLCVCTDLCGEPSGKTRTHPSWSHPTYIHNPEIRHKITRFPMQNRSNRRCLYSQKSEGEEEEKHFSESERVCCGLFLSPRVCRWGIRGPNTPKLAPLPATSGCQLCRNKRQFSGLCIIAISPPLIWSR